MPVVIFLIKYDFNSHVFPSSVIVRFKNIIQERYNKTIFYKIYDPKEDVNLIFLLKFDRLG
ncbi:MAG: hypothetical protein GY707_12925 [Desulfobacteraceae bacterium]|nr:hypothetical protein [Desulfobacteraceae bacterium]